MTDTAASYRLISSEGEVPAYSRVRLRAWTGDRCTQDILTWTEDLEGYLKGLFSDTQADRAEVSVHDQASEAEDFVACYERVETAVERRYRELAETISAQAAAVAAGTQGGPRYAAVRLLMSNVDTLHAWTTDDRSGA